MATELVFSPKRRVKKAIGTFPEGTIVSVIEQDEVTVSVLLIVQQSGASGVCAYDLNNKELRAFSGELEATELNARIEVFGDTLEED